MEFDGSFEVRREIADLLGHTSGVRWLDAEVAARCDGDAEAAQLLWETFARRLRTGMPLQYVLESWQFRKVVLRVTSEVLIPRFETESIVDHVCRSVEGRTCPSIVDLGTGSGAIAIALAMEIPESHVVATDRSNGALGVARSNAEANGVYSRINFREASWLEALRCGERFDCIVSNPPYIAREEWLNLARSVREFEPEVALTPGDRGTEAFELIVSGAPQFLVSGGSLVVEIDPRQRGFVEQLFMDAGFVEIVVYQDFSGRARFVSGVFDAGL
ncbi:MAG: peptide chain release factor N(5)-glutamine methyltransferase [Ferrimicrobium sp.]